MTDSCTNAISFHQHFHVDISSKKNCHITAQFKVKITNTRYFSTARQLLAIRISASAGLQSASLAARELGVDRAILCASVTTRPRLRANGGDACRAGALAGQRIILQPGWAR